MPQSAEHIVKVMFKEGEQEVLLINVKFQRAMAEYDGSPAGMQRLADVGTEILLPEGKRPGPIPSKTTPSPDK